MRRTVRSSAVAALLLLMVPAGPVRATAPTSADFTVASYRDHAWHYLYDLAVGDVTGDGLNDIVIAAPSNSDFYKSLLVYPQQPDHTFPAAPVEVDGGSYPWSVDVGDLNGDHLTDVVVGSHTGDIRVILQGQSGLLGAPVSYLLPVDSTAKLSTVRDGLFVPRNVKVGDVNGDGRMDVVSATPDEGVIRVYLQNAQGRLAAPVLYNVQHDGNNLAIADFNGDGRSDVIIHNQQAGRPGVGILLQNTAGTLAPPVYHNVGQHSGFCVADVNGDGRNDLVFTGDSSSSPRITVFTQNAAGGLNTPQTYPLTEWAGFVRAADVNGDGLKDVLAIGSYGDLSVYLQDGLGQLGAEQRFTKAPEYSFFEPRAFATADLNGDGAPDMVTCSNGRILQIRYNHTTADSLCMSLIWPEGYRMDSFPSPGHVILATGLKCPWTAVSDSSWLTITSPLSGSGSATINYTVAGNSSSETRTGMITVGGRTQTITQDGASCPPIISSSSRSMPRAGGSGSFAVSATTGCAWTAVSNAAWLQVTSGSPGSGPGTVSYSVALNGGTVPRTGIITVGERTFTVWQSGGYCPTSIGPATQSLGREGVTSTITVTAGGDCSWAAVSNVAWMTVTSGASGSGNGTVGYTVAPNTSPGVRTGTIQIGHQSYTVTQYGTPCPSFMNPTSRTLPASGGTGTISISAVGECQWSAVSNASWLTVTSSGSSVGDGTVTYAVAPNPTTERRGATITIGGSIHHVLQDGSIPPRTQVAPGQKISIVTSGGGYQELYYNYSTAASWVSEYQSTSMKLTYGSPKGQWIGLYHYDYDSARFSQALYSTRDGL